MPISEAKRAANRKNAQLSTGPKTPEGKARSRQNALKHGLTGSGVALPSEDQAEITRCFIALQNELQPSNTLSEKLIRRVAFLSVRLERSEKHETAETANRVRHAVKIFDDERLSAIEGLTTFIEREPVTTVRRLQLSPEGINWLLDEWDVLRGDLLNTSRDCWTYNHRVRFELLLGRRAAEWKLGRLMALTQAISGTFYHLDPTDGEGLEGPARSEWARAELIRMMDVEVARLIEVRHKLDPGAIALDRAEAVDRALFDTSPEAILARKYEAATVRELFRTLKEFRQVEAEAAAGIVSDASQYDVEDCDTVGSNFQEPEPEPSEPEVDPDSDSWTVDFRSEVSPVLDFTVGKTPETAPRAFESPGQGVA